MSNEVITVKKLQDLRIAISRKVANKKFETERFLSFIVEAIPTLLNSNETNPVRVTTQYVQTSSYGVLSAAIRFEYPSLYNFDLQPPLDTVNLQIDIVTAPDGIEGYKVTVGSTSITVTAPSVAASMVIEAHKQEISDFLRNLG